MKFVKAVGANSPFGILLVLLLALLLQGVAARPLAAQVDEIRCDSTPRKLFSTLNVAAYGDEPALNDDGSTVFFWSTGNHANSSVNGFRNDDGNVEIFGAAVDLANSASTPVFTQVSESTGNLLGGFNLSPVVSGNGRSMAFFSDRDLIGTNPEGNYEIYVYDIQAARLIQITDTRDGAHLFPSMSRDGTRIAFISDNPLELQNGKGQGSAGARQEVVIAYIADPQNPTFEMVPTATQDDGETTSSDEPQISGDGRWVVFSSVNASDNVEIYRYRVGSNAAPEQITDTRQGSNVHPAVNHDGSRIVFASDQPLVSGTHTSDPQIWLYDTVQQQFTRLTTTGANSYPSIDRAGNRIVYARTSSGQRHIYLYDMTVPPSRANRQISPGTSETGRAHPAINGDGTVIAYEEDGGISLIRCPIADLALDVSGPSTAVAGRAPIYQWRITNRGSSAAANVEVKSTLPAGFNLGTATPANLCSQAGQEVTCVVPQILVGQTSVLTLPIDVAPGVLGTFSLDVNVTSNSLTDPDHTNNNRALTTRVGAEADLALTKTASPETALEDEQITYTLTVNNGGPSLARSVRITDVLPAELTFVSSDRCTPTGGAFLCTMGDLQPNQQAVATLVTRINTPVETLVTNVATVGSAARDPQPDNNTARRSNEINTLFDLSIQMSAEPDPLLAGGPITYTLEVASPGPSIAEQVEITAAVPAQVALKLDGSGRPAGRCVGAAACTFSAVSNRTFTVAVGNVGVDAPVRVLFEGTVNPTYSGTITHTAGVRSIREAEADREAGNNQATLVSSVVRQADLTVAAIETTGDIVAGGSISYTIRVANNGPSAASDVRLTNILPTGLAVVAPDGCTGSAEITCSLGDLQPGGTAVVRMVGIPIPVGYTGSLVYTASVESATDDVIDNNSRTATTPVATRANLVLFNQAHPEDVTAGNDQVTFRLDLTNQGPSIARAVVVAIRLPASLAFSSSSVPCTREGNDVFCSLGDVSPPSQGNSNRTVEIEAAVESSATGTIVAAAAAGSDTPGTQPSNVSSTPVIFVRQSADVRLVPSIAGNLNVGGAVTYTLQAQNDGPSDVIGVVVANTIDPLFGPVTVGVSAGEYSPATGVWTLDRLTGGADATLSFSTVLSEDTSGQTLTNAADLVAVEPGDSDPLNNNPVLTVTVPAAADLAVSVDASDPTPGVLETVDYTISVTNQGPSPATGVSITYRVPASLRRLLGAGAVMVLAGDVLCVPASDGETCTWDAGDLAVGGTKTHQVQVQVVGSGDITLDVVEAKSDLHDPDPSQNEDGESVTVDPAADLVLGAEVSDTMPNVADPFVYTLNLTNGGPDSAENVVVTTVLPSPIGGASVTASGATSYTTGSGVITWTIPLIGAGDSEALHIQYTLDASTDFSLTAQIVQSQLGGAPLADPAPSNNVVDPIEIEIQAAADVRVTAFTASPLNAREGEVVAFTVGVRNDGPDQATNVVVTNTLPAELAFGQVSPGSASYNSATGAWTIGTLPAGETRTLFIFTTVKGGFAGEPIVDSTEGLRMDQHDPNPGNNIGGPVTISVIGADLAVLKEVSNERPNVGDRVVYTVTVMNGGPNSTADVRLEDPLPVGLEFQGSSASQGTYSAATHQWDVGTLASGVSATLSITAEIQSTFGGETITNTATIVSSAEADGTADNNSDSAVVEVLEADLDLTVASREPEPQEQALFQYELIVANHGPDVATNVVLTHTEPLELDTLVGVTTQGTYDENTHTWAIGTLDPEAEVVLFLSARPLIGSGGRETTLEAFVEADQEDPTPASDAATVTIVGADILVVDKRVSDGQPIQGETLHYTITVRNDGPYDAQNIVLQDILPAAGLSFDTASHGGTENAGVVTWPGFDLASGAMAIRTLTGTVVGTPGQTFTNTARIDSLDIPDNVNDNDSASVTFTVNLPPVVSIPPLSVDEGAVLDATVAFTDTDSDAWTGTVDYGDGSQVETLAIEPDLSSFTLTHVYADDGVYTLEVSIKDGEGDTTHTSQAITVHNVAPTLYVVGDQPAAGEGVLLSITDVFTFTDPGYTDAMVAASETFTFSIDWGDGVIDTGAATVDAVGSAIAPTRGSANASHMYAGDGNYEVTVTLFDDDGGSASDTFMVAVSNIPPNVTITGSTSVSESNSATVTYAFTTIDSGIGETYTLVGSPSCGANGTLSGSPTIDASTGAGSFMCIFDNGPDTPRVSIIISDGADQGEGQHDVTVNNVAPTATLGNAGPIDEGGTVDVSFSGQSDPSNADTAAGFRYAYSCTNGDLSDVTYASGSTALPSAPCTFSDDGTHTVKARIIDKDDDFSEYTTTVTVNSVAPTATLSNAGPIDEGGTVDVSFSGQSDPSSDDTAAGFRYAYSCTNGDLSDVTYASGSTASPSAPCTFSDDGTHTVKARIIDKDDGFSEYTATVTVNNVAPTATLGNDGPIDEGSPVTVSFSGQSDPSSDDTAAGFRYAYSCTNGDLSGVTYNSGSTASPSAPCTFSDDGAHTVKARIIDKDDGFSEYTTTVTVNNVAPAADAGGPYEVDEGSDVTLDASGSSDPGNDIVSYEWDLDNDGQYDDATGVTATFNRSDDGVYTVGVRVTDDDGASDTDTTTVTVHNVAPTINSVTNTGPVAVDELVTVTVDASDPAGANDPLQYEFDCDDDGIYEIGPQSGNDATCVFTVATTHTVRVRVTDDDGDEDTGTTAVTVDPGAPASLTIETQPGSATAGSAFGTQPVVALRDSFDNIVTTDSSSLVGVTILDGVDVFHDSSTVVVTVSSGQATFQDLRIDEAGNYVLAFATDAGGFMVNSETLVVSPAAADQLVFTQQPSSTATAGEAFAQQPIVEIRDEYDNVVTSAPTGVSLEPFTDAACSTQASGTLNDVAVSFNAGVATFSDVSYTNAETIYLGATHNTLPVAPACSDAIDVSAAAATKLLITGVGTQTAGESQPLTITAVDDFGNTDTTYEGVKDLVFEGANDAPDDVYQPTVLNKDNELQGFGTLVPVAFSSGVASGRSMTLYRAETATITVTDGTIASVDGTLAVTVSPAAAYYLDFTQLPEIATAGVAFSPDPVLEVWDPYGNLVTSYDSGGTLTAFADYLCGEAADPLDIAETISIGGVVTHTGVVYTVAKEIYLKAESAGLEACGGPVTVGPATADQYLVMVSSVTPNAGDEITVTAQLADEFGNPVFTPGKAITWTSTNDGFFSPVTSTTNAFGVATVNFTTHDAPDHTHEITATDEDGLTGTSETVTTQGSMMAAMADVTLAASSNGPDVLVDQPATITLSATNRGPTATDRLRLTVGTSAEVSAASVGGGAGVCDAAGGQWRCDLPGLASGASATVELLLAISTPGHHEVQAEVHGDRLDPDPDNNVLTFTVSVRAPTLYLPLIVVKTLMDPVTEPVDAGQDLYLPSLSGD